MRVIIVKTKNLKRLKRKIKTQRLNVCMIYPGGDYSPHMLFTLRVMTSIPFLEVKFRIVKAGKFPHRLSRVEKNTIQCERRQKYIDAVPNGEWLLIVDSDEIVGGALNTIPYLIAIAEHNNVDVMALRAVEIDSTTEASRSYYPRLMKKQPNLIYGGPLEQHDVIWNCNSIIHKYSKDVLNYGGNSHYYNGTCDCGYNYIEVGNDDMMLLDLVFFVHYKYSRRMQFTVATEGINFPEEVLFQHDMKELVKA